VTVDNTLDLRVSEELEQLKLAGNTYEFRLEPRCRVCKSPSISRVVNDLLANGLGYAHIMRMIAPLEESMPEIERVTYGSIRHHAKTHFPHNEAAKALYREIVERRAQQTGLDFVAATGTALTPLAFMEVVMQKAFQDLQERRAEPIPPEVGLRAADKLQNALTAAKGNEDVEQMVLQFNQLVEAVKKVVPATMWPDILAEVRHQQNDDVDVEDVETVFVGEDDV